MRTKPIPAIIMLIAGFIACLAGMNAHMEVADFLKMLLLVLIVFYILGCIVKQIIDKNFMGMLEEETTDGEETKEEEVPETEEDKKVEDEDEE